LRGTISFSTAGVPSAHVASTTRASVESGYGRPTEIPQSASIARISAGSSSIHACAPTTSAFSRTTAGISTIRRATLAPHGWRIAREHVAEYGPVVLIALGESIVATGVGASPSPSPWSSASPSARHRPRGGSLPCGVAFYSAAPAGRRSANALLVRACR